MELFSDASANTRGIFDLLIENYDSTTGTRLLASTTVEGPPLTDSTAVSEPGLSFDSKEPETDTQGTLSFTLTDSVDDLKVVLSLGASTVSKADAEDKTKFEATGFEIKSVTGYDAEGRTQSSKDFTSRRLAAADIKTLVVEAKEAVGVETGQTKAVSLKFPVKTPSKEAMDADNGMVTATIADGDQPMRSITEDISSTSGASAFGVASRCLVVAAALGFFFF